MKEPPYLVWTLQFESNELDPGILRVNSRDSEASIPDWSPGDGGHHVSAFSPSGHRFFSSSDIGPMEPGYARFRAYHPEDSQELFSAYTGQDVNRVNLDAFRQIPVPNWNIKYTGLMRIKSFKKKFKRFSLSHGYRSAYSINTFQTNLERSQLVNDNLPPVDPETQDFLPENIINNVVLTDQFNPLIRVDFEMQN